VEQRDQGSGGAGVSEPSASATPGPPPVADVPANGAVNGMDVKSDSAAADAEVIAPSRAPSAPSGNPGPDPNGGDAEADSDAPVGSDVVTAPEVGSAGQAGVPQDKPGADLNGVAKPAPEATEPATAVGSAARAGKEVVGSGPDEDPGTGRLSPDSAPVPAAKTSRAGRNLPAAIGVGVVLGAVILVTLLTVRQVFIGVVAAAVAVATVELAGAFRRSAKNIQVALIPVLVGGQAMVWLSWAWRTQGILAGFVLTMLACLAWRFRGGSEGYLRDVTASIFTAAYVPLFASFAAMLVEPHDGTARVLCFMIVVVCSDTGGYIAGVLFGKHPMAPSISPKKSWEGFTGSMLAGCVAASLAMALLLHTHWWLGLPFGAAIVLTATGGDLTESLIKRDLGIKDMGNLLPGHGGLMDRMDSLLPSAVVSWVLLSLLLPA
jgi:phosphatidate cytidylyltransferase